MNAFDLVGIIRLACTGGAAALLGKLASERRIELAMGGFNADNTDAGSWDRMNAAALHSMRRVGTWLLAMSAAGVVVAVVAPAGWVGSCCLGLATIGGFAMAMAVAKHAVAPGPHWHP